MSDVTLLDIARRMGVSKTAVSLALRGKEGVSEATKNKIVKMAREMGYAPNPVSAELMELVRAKRHAKGTQTIAFINTFQNPSLMRRWGHWDFVTGAEARAAQYGYTVEVFEARANGMTGERLADILEARGIRGILVGPRWELEPELEFPWERFACVLVGEPEYGPHLHRVCNHHAHGCATILHKLAGKGYRKIGLALAAPVEKKFGYDHMMGLEQFRLSTDKSVKVVSWLYDPWDEAAAEAWLKKHGFDALVSLANQCHPLLDRVNAPNGGKLGYAALNIEPGSSFSGINQHTEEIGGAAVDLLRGVLLSGERGTVPRPRILLVEGDWSEGTTTPGPGKNCTISAHAPA